MFMWLTFSQIENEVNFKNLFQNKIRFELNDDETRDVITKTTGKDAE